MAVFISLVTDKFEDNFKNWSAKGGSEKTGRAGASRARRPMRGLEIKDDTYALIKVIDASGKAIPLFDSSSATGKSEQNTNFILQSVQEARMEKHQIVDTFGEAYIFFFGEQPRFLDVSAVLINSNDFNWEAEFWANYDTYLRGTKLVEMGARTYLFYDDTVVEGYWLQAQAQKTAGEPLSVQLSFRLFITNISNISMVDRGTFPIRSSVNLPASIDLTTADGYTLARAAANAAGEAATLEASSLASALRGQLSQLTSGADVSGIIRSAEGFVQQYQDEARAGGQPSDLTPDRIRAISATRMAPVRGMIADNFDEFTALLPETGEQVDTNSGIEPQTGEALDAAAAKALKAHGAKVDSPKQLKAFGFLPVFVSGTRGPGSASGSATIGPIPGFASAPGGRAFTGPSILPPAALGTLAQFAAGVQTAGGLSGGVGVGGGVSGGMQKTKSWQWGSMSGGSSTQGLPPASAGYAGASLGASVSPDGVPSLFASAVVEGTLDRTGQTRTAGAYWVADKNGTRSDTFVR